MTEELPLGPPAEPIYVLIKMADRPAYMIGRVMEEGQSEVVLHYPVLITVYYDDQGMQVVTSKYMPFAKDDLVAIVKTSIHAISTPKPKFIKHYLDFVKHWRDEGNEKILEARVLGETEPVPEAAAKSLNFDVPGDRNTVH